MKLLAFPRDTCANSDCDTFGKKNNLRYISERPRYFLLTSGGNLNFSQGPKVSLSV